MRFSVWPGSNQPWSELLATCVHAEQTGWDGVWVADHLMRNDLDGSTGWGLHWPPARGPVLECWTTIAALASVVPRVRIGPLVSANTFRHPTLLAKMAATVDQISGGRLVLGLGAGWQESEHRAYGLAYHDVLSRLRRLEEACVVIRSLFAEERTDFDGRYYQLSEAPSDPKPVQQHVPLVIGGRGEKTTLRIVAEHADEWNLWASVDGYRRKSAVLDQHCERVGRDPAAISHSAQAAVCISKDQDHLKHVRERGMNITSVIGTPGQVLEELHRYAGAGLDEFVVADGTLGESLSERLDSLDLLNEEVIPELR